MSIEIKQKIKEVADDLKMPTKEVIEIVGKFYDKPKSSSQNLTEDQLNVIFDHITRNHQIDSLEQVFAVKAAPAPAVSYTHLDHHAAGRSLPRRDHGPLERDLGV